MIKIKDDDLLGLFYFLRRRIYEICQGYLRSSYDYNVAYTESKRVVYDLIINPVYIYYVDKRIKTSTYIDDVIYFESAVAFDNSINRLEDSIYLKFEDRVDFIMKYSIEPILNLFQIQKTHDDKATKAKKTIESLMDKMFVESRKLNMTPDEYFDYLKQDLIRFTEKHVMSKPIEQPEVSFNFNEII